MTRSGTLYSQVVELGEEFLGPAGERFMRRQITTHLGIEPEQLRPKHLPQLIDWARLAMAMLTNNEKEVRAFTQSLQKLATSVTKK